MRLSCRATFFALTLAATVVRAEPTLEQLQASYDETVKQLQQSQDRKNQLANENEQLKARVAELEGKLNAIDAQARQAEFLRSQFVAWSTFLERYPLLLKRFQELAQSGTETTAATPPEPFFDPEWPFSAAGRVEEHSFGSPVDIAPSTATTMPQLAQFFHRAARDACAICIDFASRAAAAERPTGDQLAAPAAGELLEDLPPR